MAPRFSLQTMEAAYAGSVEAIEQLSSSVMTALRDRERAGRAAVRLKGAIPDRDAAHYCYMMVKACNKHRIAPPDELVRLLQTVLKQDKPPQGNKGVLRRSVEHEEAVRYLANNAEAGNNEIAKHVGVHPATVSRWGLLRK